MMVKTLNLDNLILCLETAFGMKCEIKAGSMFDFFFCPPPEINFSSMLNTLMIYRT